MKHPWNTNLTSIEYKFNEVIFHWVDCRVYSFMSGNPIVVHEMLQFSKVMKLNGMYYLAYPHYYVDAFSLVLVIIGFRPNGKESVQ